MSATETPVYNIDILASLPEEALTGRLGQVYAKQFAAQYAQQRYEDTLYWIESNTDFRNIPLGSSTTDLIFNHPEARKARKEMDEAVATMKAAQAEVGGLVLCMARVNLEKANKAIAALNRKGLTDEPITLTESLEVIYLSYTYFQGQFGPDSDSDFISEHSTFEHVFCVLSGQTPVIPGFQFLASVTPTEAGNIISKVPVIRFQIQNPGQTDEMAAAALDAIDLSRFRSTGALCEHCNKVRARKDCYIVYNAETGETKQVGRTCLRDYTGANDPERILKAMEQYMEVLRMAKPSAERGELSTEFFLTHVACMIREHGFQKGYTKTGEEAMNNIANQAKKAKGRQGEQYWIDPTEVDEKNAQRALAFANEFEPNNDFGLNVKIAVSNPGLPSGKHNIAAWIFPLMDGEAEKKAKAEAQAKANETKGWVGVEGERGDFTLTLVRIHTREGYNGGEVPTYIFNDADGNEVVWRASNWADLDEGATYKVKATVKKADPEGRWGGHRDHPTFGKSTHIERVKILETIKEA